MSELRIAILGPQGSGKGTQAELLSYHFGIPAITMSDLLRDRVAEGGPEAARIDELVREGKLVPYEITIELLRKRLNGTDAQKGFILDGFPRDRDQQDAFAEVTSLTDVVFLDISDEVALERIQGRLICEGCGKVYHREWQPPKQGGVCDSCGGRLVHRADDVPSVIAERLAIYHRETEPVTVEYGRRGILRRVDALGPIPVIHTAILEVLRHGGTTA